MLKPKAKKSKAKWAQVLVKNKVCEKTKRLKRLLGSPLQWCGCLIEDQSNELIALGLSVIIIGYHYTEESNLTIIFFVCFMGAQLFIR